MRILINLVVVLSMLHAFLWEGYEIVPNGITMTTDAHGRTAGDAYVQFSSQNVAERAINDKNMKRIGHRLVGGVKVFEREV